MTKADYEEDNYFKFSQFSFITKKYILYIGVAYFILLIFKIIIA